MNLNCSSDNVLHVEGALVISFTRDISAVNIYELPPKAVSGYLMIIVAANPETIWLSMTSVI